MKFRFAILSFALAALPALAVVDQPPKPATEAFHRIKLEGPQGQALPYTIEIPAGWQVRLVQGYPGVWLGPKDAWPPNDPRLVWVRGSVASLAEPEKVAAALKAGDTVKHEWTAPRVEVKDLGGVRGVLVRMDSGEGDKARSTLALKLPLEKMGVDFLNSGPRAEFEKQLPLYERILLSVRPLAPAK